MMTVNTAPLPQRLGDGPIVTRFVHGSDEHRPSNRVTPYDRYRPYRPDPGAWTTVPAGGRGRTA